VLPLKTQQNVMNKPIRITPRIRVKSEFFLNGWMIENRTSQGAEKLQAPEANPNGEFVSGKACGETGIVLHARAGPGLSAKNLSVSKRLHTSTPLGSIQFIVFGFGEGRFVPSHAGRAYRRCFHGFFSERSYEVFG
jgi:hypothetical protein